MDQKVFRVVIHLRAESQLDASMLLSSVLADERCEAVEVLEVKDGKIASVFDAVAGQEEQASIPDFRPGDVVVYKRELKGFPHSVLCRVSFKQGDTKYGISPVEDTFDKGMLASNNYIVEADELSFYNT
jgi:hypothetical protein